MKRIAPTRGVLPFEINAGGREGNGLGNNAPRVLHAVRVHPNCMTPWSRDTNADPSKELPQPTMQGMCWQSAQPSLSWCIVLAEDLWTCCHACSESCNAQSISTTRPCPAGQATPSTGGCCCVSLLVPFSDETAVCEDRCSSGVNKLLRSHPGWCLQRLAV